MAKVFTSRRALLKRLASTAMVAGLGGPFLSSCASGPVVGSLADRADLDGAALEAVLRGSFIPALDAHSEFLAQQWQQDRNASIDVLLSQDYRMLAQRTAQDRRGADLAELFGFEPQVYSDRLVDVSEVAERIGDSLGGWTQVARDVCTVDGMWRAIPWSTTRHSLVVRSDLLEDVGASLPETYDDLLETGVLLLDGGAPPIGIAMSANGPADSSAIAYGILWAFGAQEVDESGKVALDCAETRAALEYFKELSEVNVEGALSWTHPGNNNAYLGGEIAITQNPSSIYLEALEVAPEIAASTTHIPLPEGPAGRFQLPEVNSLAVFQHSLDPAAAIDFIEYANSAEALVARASESLAFHAPLVDGLDEHPEMPWRTDPQLEGLSSSAAEGRMPGWPMAPGVESDLVYQNASIVNMFSSVGSGDMQVSEALSTATEELRRVYET